MADPKDPKDPPVDCGCKIPVCLEFTHATSTDDFKLELKAIFESACSSNEEVTIDSVIIDSDLTE